MRVSGESWRIALFGLCRRVVRECKSYKIVGIVNKGPGQYSSCNHFIRYPESKSRGFDHMYAQTTNSLIAQASHLQVSTKLEPGRHGAAQDLLGSNNLASHELGSGVGEVLDIVHDGLESIGGASGLLEVLHAAPLEGGLDAVGSVGTKVEDLYPVSDDSLGWNLLWLQDGQKHTFQDLRP